MTGAIKNGQEFHFNIAIEKFLELNEFEGDKQYKWISFTIYEQYAHTHAHTHTQSILVCIWANPWIASVELIVTIATAAAAIHSIECAYTNTNKHTHELELTERNECMNKTIHGIHKSVSFTVFTRTPLRGLNSKQFHAFHNIVVLNEPAMEGREQHCPTAIHLYWIMECGSFGSFWKVRVVLRSSILTPLTSRSRDIRWSHWC